MTTLRPAYTNRLKPLLLAVAFCVLLPGAANASAFCPNMFDGAGFTYAVVTCVKNMFTLQAGALRGELHDYMDQFIYPLMVIACMIFGMRVLGGGARGAEAISFFVRMAVAVALFEDTANIVTGMTAWPDEFMGLAGVGSPWADVDAFIGKMLGVGVGWTMASGVFGLLSGAIFSSTFAVVMFFTGVKAILDVIFFIIQALFVYLTAVMLVAFLVIISPIILPFAMFYYTEKYVLAWAKIMASAILTPMFLFICINSFIHLFSTTIDELFAILGGNDFDTFWRSEVPAFSWLLPSDSNYSQELELTNTGADLQTPAITSNVNPLMRLGVNANVMNLAGLTFGVNTVGIIQKLVLKFGELILLTYVVKSLVDQIPSIVAQITESRAVLGMQPTQVEREVKTQVANLQSKLSQPK